MKKASVTILLFFSGFLPALCGLGSSAAATAESLPSVRYITEPVATRQGDSLVVSFCSRLEGRLGNSMSMHVVPVFISGRDTIRFPEVGYFTPSGAKYVARARYLSGQKTEDKRSIVRRGESCVTDYHARRAVPCSFDGELQILHLIRTCCCTRVVDSRSVSLAPGQAEAIAAVPAPPVAGESVVAAQAVPREPANVPMPTPPGAAVADARESAAVELPREIPPPRAVVNIPLFEANVTFIRPGAEAVKERSASVEVRVTYPVNHHRVYPDFAANKEELRRLDRVMAPLVADTAIYQIQEVSISGYASLEDTWNHNMTLSKRRAEGMRDYLHEHYGLSPAIILAEGKGEDWDGLRALVARSNMAEKNAILSIIDNYTINTGREKRLMDLKGGVPYRAMMKDLFPALRRMELLFSYRVSAFGSAEAEELIESRGGDLGLLEIYEVARAKGGDEAIRTARSHYGRFHDIAVRYFPTDPVANINAASAALVRGDLERARECLIKVKDNPAALNNLGVYYWLTGNHKVAEACFLRAAETSPADPAATHNLQQLRATQRGSM